MKYPVPLLFAQDPHSKYCWITMYSTMTHLEKGKRLSHDKGKSRKRGKDSLRTTTLELGYEAFKIGFSSGD